MPHHAARVLLFAPQASLPDAAAAWLLQEYGAQAPDYSGLTLVTPTPALAQALATALLKASGGALLAPRSTTLGGFIAAALPADCPTPLACRIRIAEAVGRHRKVFPGQPPLGVAEALYELFEQLAAAQLTLPDEPALIARLQAAYGAPRTLAGLSQEARIVHTLYRAFLEDLGHELQACCDAGDLIGICGDINQDTTSPEIIAFFQLCQIEKLSQVVACVHRFYALTCFVSN